MFRCQKLNTNRWLIFIIQADFNYFLVKLTTDLTANAVRHFTSDETILPTDHTSRQYFKIKTPPYDLETTIITIPRLVCRGLRRALDQYMTGLSMLVSSRVVQALALPPASNHLCTHLLVRSYQDRTTPTPP